MINAVPTTVVTGFLGVGKTTAIRDLLNRKPPHERWAVLINEFGEIGIDAGLLGNTSSTSEDVFIREIPGGCMCCTAGLPMQIALNRLLQRARPHRLLIEPTGLGHPREVLEVLRSPFYREVIDLRATLTLLDARRLEDPRVTSSDTFKQQIAVADVVIANKSDLYQPADRQRLLAYLGERAASRGKPVYWTAHGAIETSLLEAPAGKPGDDEPPDMEEETSLLLRSQPGSVWGESKIDLHEGGEDIPECGFAALTAERDGYTSIGWRFAPTYVFSRSTLNILFQGMDVLRLKAVAITDEGVIGFNLSDSVLTELSLDDCLESRVEIIVDGPLDSGDLEARLLRCVVEN